MIKALIVKQVAKAVVKEVKRYSFDVAMDKVNNKVTVSVIRKKGN
jgi:hypothetical protein